MRKIIYLLLIFLSGCATMNKPEAPAITHYRDWCSTCGNKGFIECDICYHGIMVQSNHKCWKCKGLGLLECPECKGQSNPNGEWKSVR